MMIVALLFLIMAIYVIVIDYVLPTPEVLGVQSPTGPDGLELSSLHAVLEQLNGGMVDSMVAELSRSGFTEMVPLVEEFLSLPASYTLVTIAVTIGVMSKISAAKSAALAIESEGDFDVSDRQKRLNSARERLRGTDSVGGLVGSGDAYSSNIRKRIGGRSG